MSSKKRLPLPPPPRQLVVPLVMPLVMRRTTMTPLRPRLVIRIVRTCAMGQGLEGDTEAAFSPAKWFTRGRGVPSCVVECNLQPHTPFAQTRGSDTDPDKVEEKMEEDDKGEGKDENESDNKHQAKRMSTKKKAHQAAPQPTLVSVSNNLCTKRVGMQACCGFVLS